LCNAPNPNKLLSFKSVCIGYGRVKGDARVYDALFRNQLGKSAGRNNPAGPVDIRLEHGDVLRVGDLKMEVIHTPGHTMGSACFLVSGNHFTGDTLFVGAVGRTDLTGASLDTLLESLEKRLLVLPKDTIIWPGHDYGDTPSPTISREMKENPYITDFIL